MKTKTKIKKCITTKNTRCKKTYSVYVLNLSDEIDKLNVLIDNNNISYEEKEDKIYGFTDLLNKYNIIPPKKLIIPPFKSFDKQIDDILNGDKFTLKEKVEIIGSIINTYYMNELDVPYILTNAELVIIYLNDKNRFFWVFDNIIKKDINDAEKNFNMFKKYLNKDDAEKLELLIYSKKYNI